MKIAVIGVNFQGTNIEKREYFTNQCRVLLEKRFSKLPHVFLVTCNRVELYFSSLHHSIVESLLIDAMEAFDQEMYCLKEDACFTHLAQVTAGLESAVFGETEIQRQVKLAYDEACKTGVVSSPLHYLFQKSLHLGKVIRTNFGFNQPRFAVAQVISHYLTGLFEKPQLQPTLFIGHSAINRQVIEYLQKVGWESLYLCTRQPEKVALSSVEVFHREHLSKWTEFPVVIVGVKSEGYLVKLQEHMYANTRCIIDMGVPRNVDPAVSGKIEGELLNIDHLIALEKSRKKSKVNAVSATNYIEMKITQYMQKYRQKTLVVGKEVELPPSLMTDSL